ncbi:MULTISPECIES: hypothetical protein [unclassified Janthinobacterium]|uniref:hypothetical protein n=1 Tax=unclassified Janthinobacterium TaxID=2610881 RepID=UPI00088F44ED|nr:MULTISPECIES: hypothetical protein [unclassified Janthinobacterium]SDA41648.1 hypothetical protein SAMN03159349_00517 [Janthinobacterium sp. 551a]SFA86613.1 hypothetical protein SAMN03159300_101517 [Janthinobacterium sp. 344]
MKKVCVLLLMLLAGAAHAPLAGGQGRQPPSEAQIRQRIIAESIAAYPGRCPCPYNAARNGSACGARSAWSRKGGYAPLCYDRDVSSDMVRRWRQENAGAGAAGAADGAAAR